MKIPLALLFVLSSLQATAQQEAILKPIQTLFHAMKRGDTATMRNLFHPRASLYTVVKHPQTGQPSLRAETVTDFLRAVGRPRTDTYDEVTWNEKVSIDGDFAQVWADYAFFLNGTFHHCGVDAFQLLRNDRGEWLIFVLSDTRRTTDCNVPAAVEKSIKK